MAPLEYKENYREQLMERICDRGESLRRSEEIFETTSASDIDDEIEI